MSRGRSLRIAVALFVPLAAVVAALNTLTPQVPQAVAAPQPAKPFALQQGDHVAVIGNALPDRMQHDGWLETMLHARLPDLELTVRDLGFSGDEVGGYTANPNPNKRMRSAAFGTPDAWFKRVGADVVLAFFGYNESFAGEEGLPQFQADLESFLRHTLNQKYGRANARVVLFSPIAHENLKSPNLPNGEENNKRLAMYTNAMKETAAKFEVPFVDLFTPTKALYAAAKAPLTINGIHLTSEGNKAVAGVIEKSLFGSQNADAAVRDKIRAAVLDKNFHWYQRYRATDGYSVYGGRADLKFTDGQTNRVVAQRELEVIDVMCVNRDKVIWAAAKGEAAKPDDSKLPPFIPVVTNKLGKGPNGEHIFLSGEDGIKQMTVGKGLKVNLFADESMFKELVNPVQMAWDTKGRLWVATWPTYPHWKPTGQMNDKLLILEDTNGDGRADTCKVFADNLHNPTGFEFYNGGVLVAQAPDLVFLKDTNGDDKADVMTRVMHGLDTADTHHTSNSFVLDPGGAVYFQEGTFHYSQVETPYGPPQRVANGGVFRYDPRTMKPEIYVTFGFANPHGHVFDRWGQDIIVDGTGANPYHGPLFSGYLPYPDKHARPPQVYQQRTRPCGGMEIMSSGHFPPEFEGNLAVTNCITFHGVLRYKISDVGSSLGGQELEPILSSTDPHFRPVEAKMGPDGALYVADWHNPIIGHMQHNLRDPSRDNTHGRVYRVSYEGRQPSVPAKIAGEPVEKLLDLLKHPEDRVRYRAKIELGGRGTDEVMLALKKWVAALDTKHPDYEHHRLEALWLRQYHNVVDVKALEGVLKSPDFRARAAAVRVLCYQRDRVPEALDLLKVAAADEHARVRLIAVWAASFFKVPEAAEVVFIARDKPTDLYITHTATETMRALDPLLKKAIASKTPIKFTTTSGSRYLVKSVATEDLLKMDRTPGVNLELLFRSGVRDEFRREALSGLAVSEGKPELAVLVKAIDEHDKSTATEESVAFDLIRLLTSRPQAEIAGVRADLEKLALTGKTQISRELAFVSLIAADGDVEKTWALAAKSVPTLTDLVAAMPMIRDAGQRAALYPKIEALLGGLPAELAATVGKDKPTAGRFVRVELPGPQRTLTLAEVEVMSDGVNVARKGKASQINTSHGGTAGRAIDGNKNGNYNAGGQTHTQEGIANPWWEVDLGREVPVQKILVYNRTDTNLSDRLKGFTLKLLDKDRKVVFETKNNPAKDKSEFAVGAASPERIVRRSAMLAITSVRGKEAAAFQAISKFVGDEAERPFALQAVLRIPSKEWPKDSAAPLLGEVMKFIRSLPVAERTSPVALDAMTFGESLTEFLPADQAKAARKELAEIGVRVIRVGTKVDQMEFDRERLIVQAGKPVEFVFENTDIMPHNFVIVTPGQLAPVGNAAEAFATQPAAAGKHFVPPMPGGTVLLASKLLQPRESEQLRFTAPKQPGIYPYVCTYPGHWLRMHGALYVVADLEEYTANPEAYLAKNPLPVKDDLLKFNRPRTEWKLAELTEAVAEMEAKGGRNFATGRQMFTIGTCVACHKFGNQGNDFGPDLTKLDPKEFKSAADVVKHMLDPSLRIEDKYASYTLTLGSGKTVTGMIVEEKNGVVKLIENPVASAKPLEIKAEDIDGRRKAATSIMPKGLLDKLTKDEILDLTAYVWGKADPKSKLFGGHDHK
jgi:putative heme-binding domain-containing protein